MLKLILEMEKDDQLAKFDNWPWPKPWPLKCGTPSKKFCFGLKYMCAKFGALGQRVTISLFLAISHPTKFSFYLSN